MLEEEKVEGGRRDGDFDGTHRPKSGVQGFENEWLEWRAVALVWREDEQSKSHGWETSKRFHSTFLPCTLTHKKRWLYCLMTGCWMCMSASKRISTTYFFVNILLYMVKEKGDRGKVKLKMWAGMEFGA